MINYFDQDILSLETKIELINRLSDTGLKVIESASFVSPKWVPQVVKHCINLLISINVIIIYKN